MWLTRLALRNPIFILMLSLASMVLGLTSFSKLAIDLFPNISIPMIVVATQYPGASPQDIEKTITFPFERAVSSVPGIDHVESTSKQGFSIIRVWFDWGANLDTGEVDVIQRVQQVMSSFPPGIGIEQPFVLKIDLSNIPVASVVVSGAGLDERQLYDLAYNVIEPQLEHLPHVAQASVSGGKIRQINVNLDRDLLRARGVAVQDVVHAVANENLMLPSGQLIAGGHNYNLFTNTQFQRALPIGRVVIKKGPNGEPIHIDDLGRVVDGSQTQTDIVRVNGSPAVYLRVQKQPGANTVGVVDAILAALPQLRGLPPKLDVRTFFDQSTYIRNAIASLEHEALQGSVLAMLVILAFLVSFRSTFIVSLAIPLSIVLTFILLYFAEQTLNVFTLGGLALSVGRLVDDAIVELENIHRHFQIPQALLDEEGRRQAVLDAAQEVAMPIFASTVTTIVVFFPVIFLAGLPRLLFLPLTLTITFALICSFVVSRTVTPLLCLRILRPEAPPLPGEDAGALRLFRRWLVRSFVGLFDRIEEDYRALLGWALRHRALVLTSAVLLFFASLFTLRFVGKAFFPATDESQFSVAMRAPIGTRVERTEAMAEIVQRAIREVVPPEHLQTILSDVGLPSGIGSVFGTNTGSHSGSISVQLVPPDRRDVTSDEYMERARRALVGRLPGVGAFFTSGGIVTRVMNFGTNAPIDAVVSGYDLKEGAAYAQHLAQSMRDTTGLTDVQISREENYPEFDVNVDREKAALLGFSEADIANTVLTALSGDTLTPSIFTDPVTGNQYSIIVQLEERFRSSLGDLAGLFLQTPGGQSVALTTVAEITRSSGPVSIDRKYQQRIIDLTANPVGRDLGAVSDELERRLLAVPKPPGFGVTLSGQSESQRTAFKALGFAAILALVLVYMVLASQFESLIDPLIIMFFSVPFGISGCFLGLFLTKTALSVNAFMGLIMTVGIAVSNGVLMVDFTKVLRQRGVPLRQAVVDAAQIRLRPILMTTLATILGLIPMALGLGVGSEANLPLARAVIGGLTVSTAITLLLVPCLYTLFEERLGRSDPATAPAAEPVHT